MTPVMSWRFNTLLHTVSFFRMHAIKGRIADAWLELQPRITGPSAWCPRIKHNRPPPDTQTCGFGKAGILHTAAMPARCCMYAGLFNQTNRLDRKRNV
jgi:hypothetical protein